jgi:hypothetical protein
VGILAACGSYASREESPSLSESQGQALGNPLDGFRTEASAQSPGCGMPLAFLGKNPLTPFYPDTHANYWAFAWNGNDLPPRVGIRVKGKFPAARYLSFALYDRKTGNIVTNLADHRIAPDPGSLNPFRRAPAADAAAVGRNPAGGTSAAMPPGDGTSAGVPLGQDQTYTVHFVPESSGSAPVANAIAVPAAVEVPVFLLRYYLDESAPDTYGGEKLPAVEAVNLDTGDVVACPAEPAFRLPSNLGGTFLSSIWNTLKFKEPDIHFYYVKGAGLYPNPDNHYLTTRLFTGSFGDVAIVRFRMPDRSRIAPGSSVRYESLCMGNLLTTMTPSNGCVMDSGFRPDAEGIVTFVISDDSATRDHASSLGFNALAKGSRFPLVLFRQMLPDASFEGAIPKVQVADPTRDVHGQEADRILGDFAPTGYYCSREDFLRRGLSCKSSP